MSLRASTIFLGVLLTAVCLLSPVTALSQAGNSVAGGRFADGSPKETPGWPSLTDKFLPVLLASEWTITDQQRWMQDSPTYHDRDYGSIRFMPDGTISKRGVQANTGGFDRAVKWRIDKLKDGNVLLWITDSKNDPISCRADYWQSSKECILDVGTLAYVGGIYNRQGNHFLLIASTSQKAVATPSVVSASTDPQAAPSIGRTSGQMQNTPPKWKEGFRAVTTQEIKPLVGTWHSANEPQVIAISADGAIYQDTASGDFWGNRGYFHDGKIWLEVSAFRDYWLDDVKREANGTATMHLSYNSDGVLKSGAYYQISSGDPRSGDIKRLPVPPDALICWSKILGEWGTQWVRGDYYFQAMKIPYKGDVAYYLAGLPRYDNDRYWGIGTCSVCTTDQLHRLTDAIKRLSTQANDALVAGKNWNSEPATIKTLNVVGDDEIPDPDDNSFYHPGVRWYSKVERRESVLIVLGWSTGKEWGIDVHMTNGEMPVFSFKSTDVPTLLQLLDSVEKGPPKRNLYRK